MSNTNYTKTHLVQLLSDSEKEGRNLYCQHPYYVQPVRVVNVKKVKNDLQIRILRDGGKWVVLCLGARLWIG